MFKWGLDIAELMSTVHSLENSCLGARCLAQHEAHHSQWILPRFKRYISQLTAVATLAQGTAGSTVWYMLRV